MKTSKFAVRQGDVYIEAIDDAVPRDATLTKREAGRIILAHGEATGHAHAIAGKGAKVVEIFEACEPGKWLTLEDEDWATLKAIVEAPTMTQPPLVAVQLLAVSSGRVAGTGGRRIQHIFWTCARWI